MHLRPRPIAPGVPLVSISVSFVALRLLSWGEPKVLTGKSGDAAAFAGPSLGNRRQHSSSKGLRIFPWAQAVPLDVPMAQGAPPSVVDDLLKSDADVASRTSGELSSCCCIMSTQVQGSTNIFVLSTYTTLDPARPPFCDEAQYSNTSIYGGME